MSWPAQLILNLLISGFVAAMIYSIAYGALHIYWPLWVFFALMAVILLICYVIWFFFIRIKSDDRDSDETRPRWRPRGPFE